MNKETIKSLTFTLHYAEKGTEHPSNTEWLERDGRWCIEATDKDDVRLEDTSGHSPEEALSKILILLNKDV